MAPLARGTRLTRSRCFCRPVDAKQHPAQGKVHSRRHTQHLNSQQAARREDVPLIYRSSRDLRGHARAEASTEEVLAVLATRSPRLV